MKNNKKVTAIIEGIIILVLGILIAVLGIEDVVNYYIATIAIILGACLLGYACYLLIKKQPLLFAPISLGGALISIGVGIFVGYLGFEMVIRILHFALMGSSVALIVYGFYCVAKYNALYGLAQVVIGAAIYTFCLCYYFIPSFAQAFWIIVGVLVAVYGGLLTVFALMNKKLK